jgi:AraC family transcriptional regulator
MDITVRTFKPMRVAAVVTRRPAIDFRGAWQGVHPGVRAQGLVRPGARFMATFRADALDGPASMHWYAAGMTLEADQTVAAPLEELLVEAGAYAVGVHKGPYDGLPGAWGAFVKGLLAAGHEPQLARPCLEIYLDDPGATPAEGLRTELCVPIVAGATSGST